ncbi:unnamed protein product, partial [Discosporangium mesarthrocarpum]
ARKALLAAYYVIDEEGHRGVGEEQLVKVLQLAGVGITKRQAVHIWEALSSSVSFSLDQSNFCLSLSNSPGGHKGTPPHASDGVGNPMTWPCLLENPDSMEDKEKGQDTPKEEDNDRQQLETVSSKTVSGSETTHSPPTPPASAAQKPWFCVFSLLWGSGRRPQQSGCTVNRVQHPDHPRVAPGQCSGRGRSKERGDGG